MFSSHDHECMATALRLAKKGMYSTAPNPRVGCVISNKEQIVARGWHRFPGGPHAEIEAINSANTSLAGATAYVTLEPCAHYGKTPPCCEALHKQGIARVVVATEDPNPQVAGKGIAYLRAQGIEVEVGLQESHAKNLNPGFNSRMIRGRPWVRIKLAASIDGQTALHNGVSKWITGSAARDDVQRWRARSDCILTGSGTMLADDPSLNVRLDCSDLRQPIRAIVDSQLLTPRTANMFRSGGAVKIFTRSKSNKYKDIENVSVIESKLSGKRKLDLTWILEQLADAQINEVHVEAGPGLCGALLQEKLVDELVVYQAGIIMGSGARGMFNGPELCEMESCRRFSVHDVRRIGSDVRTIYHLAN